MPVQIKERCDPTLNVGASVGQDTSQEGMADFLSAMVVETLLSLTVADQIVFSNALICTPKSPDPGKRQYKSST